MEQDIEKILNPIFKKICEYYSFKEKGVEVPQEFMMSEIKTELTAISQKCATYPILQQQHALILKPLIFFIDYSIKEGGFSFSKSYGEIARTFNEFSGDEKFFDLLKETMVRNDDEKLTRLFFTMLGLGFDGTYKRERSEILEIMKNCSESFHLGPDFSKEKISPDIVTEIDYDSESKYPRFSYKSRKFWTAVIVGFTFISFVANWISLDVHVSDYLNAVENTVKAAVYDAGKNVINQNNEKSNASSSEDKDKSE
jgi:hypothetical protein